MSNLIGKSKVLMAQEANKVDVSLPLLSDIVENFSQGNELCRVAD